MKTKNTNLKVVEQQDEGAKRQQEEERWKLTRAEVTARVSEICSYLQDASNRMAGLRFDIMNSDEPLSLDYDELPYPVQLAERLNPLLAADYERLCSKIPGPSADDLTEHRTELAETVFAIGVLAGAVFHGASGREIDRLEQGLVHATMSRDWQVKS